MFSAGYRSPARPALIRGILDVTLARSAGMGTARQEPGEQQGAQREHDVIYDVPHVGAWTRYGLVPSRT